MSFETFQLNPRVAAGVTMAGYTKPTPIQAQAIPAVMERRDVMGLAQTGTGKTAAFALPLLHRLMRGKRGQVRALVIAPTRELAEQINTAIKELGQQTGLRSMTAYGGVNINPQKTRLKKGTEIVVACPGRLLDHINQGTIDLSKLEMLILDEADQMFDMGFFPDIRRILARLPKERQTLLFSATMPAEIRKLANEVLCKPVTVQVDTVAPATTVSHALYPVAQHLKTGLLLDVLQQTDTESVLIFTRTKHRAKKLGLQLAKSGYKATSLQGNLTQNRRQEALDGFRKGRYQILVATDIAARGIDVTQVSHVINFDIPDTPEAYIHRIGRTGRAARSGDAFTLIAPEDSGMVKAIERKCGSRIEQRTIDGFDYDKPAPVRQVQKSRKPNEKKTPGNKPASNSASTPAKPKGPRRPRKRTKPAGNKAPQTESRISNGRR